MPLSATISSIMPSASRAEIRTTPRLTKSYTPVEKLAYWRRQYRRAYRRGYYGYGYGYPSYGYAYPAYPYYGYAYRPYGYYRYGWRPVSASVSGLGGAGATDPTTPENQLTKSVRRERVFRNA